MTETDGELVSDLAAPFFLAIWGHLPLLSIMSIMSYCVLSEMNVKVSLEKLTKSLYLSAADISLDLMAAKLEILNKSLRPQVYGVEVMRRFREKDVWP